MDAGNDMDVWGEKEPGYKVMTMSRRLLRGEKELARAQSWRMPDGRGFSVPDLALINAAWCEKEGKTAARSYWREVYQQVMKWTCCATRATVFIKKDDDGRWYRPRFPEGLMPPARRRRHGRPSE